MKPQIVSLSDGTYAIRGFSPDGDEVYLMGDNPSGTMLWVIKEDGIYDRCIFKDFDSCDIHLKKYKKTIKEWYQKNYGRDYR